MKGVYFYFLSFFFGDTQTQTTWAETTGRGNGYLREFIRDSCHEESTASFDFTLIFFFFFFLVPSFFYAVPGLGKMCSKAGDFY